MTGKKSQDASAGKESRAVAYHKRMLAKYAAEIDPVQGRDWLESMIEYHANALYELGIDPTPEK